MSSYSHREPRRVIELVLVGFAITFLSACGSADNSSQSSSLVSDLVNSSADLLQTSDTASQLIGINRQEYRVLQFSGEEPAGDVESALNILGEEGWDCNPVSQGQSSLRFLCKRRSHNLSHQLTRLGSELFASFSKEKKQDSSRF